MAPDEIERALAEIGVVLRSPPTAGERALDEILGSRTHVRVLRVLTEVSGHINLSGRRVATLAGVARARCLQVLRDLAGLGVVRITWTTIHAVYRLADDHPLFVVLHALFAAERHAAQGARRSAAQPPPRRA